METIRKIQGDRITGGLHKVLELPEVEPWPEAVDAAVLLEELKQTLGQYVVLPRWAAETLALWILHTYAFALRDVSTYVGVESPEKRCGKSTLLSALSELVNRPVVAANISAPALFRVIEETCPTLLIDEADTLLSGNDELRGILNSGYTRKTAYVVRVAGINRYAPASEAGSASTGLARYSCWCPKIMAAIGRLPETLADRCIIISMQRKDPQQRCERLKDLDAVSLRRKCARVALDHGPLIADAAPEIPGELHDRAGEVWEPLFALADLAGGDWPDKARQAARGLTESGLSEPSPRCTLLLDLYVMFLSDRSGRMFSRRIVDILNSIDDKPWADALKIKYITQQWLARQLSPYGIRPKTIWIGTVAGKGYLKEDFLEAVVRYIPQSELEALRKEVGLAAARLAKIAAGGATAASSEAQALAATGAGGSPPTNG